MARNARESVPSTLSLEPEPVIADSRLLITGGIETSPSVLTPISLLAAYDGPELVRACLKPVDRVQLRQVIDDPLARFRLTGDHGVIHAHGI
jgi:hypothetical protein